MKMRRDRSFLTLKFIESINQVHFYTLTMWSLSCNFHLVEQVLHITVLERSL